MSIEEIVKGLDEHKTQILRVAGKLDCLLCNINNGNAGYQTSETVKKDIAAIYTLINSILYKD